MDGGRGRQGTERIEGVEGGPQQRRVVSVGRRGHGPEGDAVGVDHDRAFRPGYPLGVAAIDRTAAGDLAPARRLGDAAVDGEPVQLQPDHPVVAVERDRPEPLHAAEGHPFVAAAAERGGRAGRIGDPVVGTPEDRHLDEFVEDRPIRNPWPMTAEGMDDRLAVQQRRELAPNGLDDR
jgi:hypothetical protein